MFITTWFLEPKWIRRLGGGPYRHLFATHFDVVSEATFFTKNSPHKPPFWEPVGPQLRKTWCPEGSGKIALNMSGTKSPTLPRNDPNPEQIQSNCETMLELLGLWGASWTPDASK